MNKKYPKISQNEDGWSAWLKPVMKNYKMGCCDCGLVHNIDFKIIKEGKLVKEYGDGNHVFEYSEVSNPKYQVSLRASRNSRATGQLRRFNKFKFDS